MLDEEPLVELDAISSAEFSARCGHRRIGVGVHPPDQRIPAVVGLGPMAVLKRQSGLADPAEPVQRRRLRLRGNRDLSDAPCEGVVQLDEGLLAADEMDAVARPDACGRGGNPTTFVV